MMNTNKRKPALISSLLDRLMDDEPHKSHDVVKTPHQQLMALRTSVRRDLENLLNTRRSEFTWPALWQQIDHSLMTYGIFDITGRVLDAVPLQNQLCQEISAVIEKFEPRLQDVEVTLFGTDIRSDRILRLRIHAWLAVNSVPEPVVFDSLLKPEAGSFQVMEGDGY